MQNITVSIIQSALHWEAPAQNRELFAHKIDSIDQPTDLIVLPEMFSTGFTMNPAAVAEPMEGPTMQWMKDLAEEKDCVITGSLVIEAQGSFFNRLIWMPPDGQYQVVDKKHLFSHSGEDKHYTPGGTKLIVTLKGWKIMPLICYDLRFPAWSRNQYHAEHGFDYDCLLYVANWPQARSHAWRVLMMARAIENQSYVIGLNRVGQDGNQIDYSGDSAIIDPQGENISSLMPFGEGIDTRILSSCQLNSYRQAFQPWNDWDQFEIKS